jgi:Amt family ammonium transporter
MYPVVATSVWNGGGVGEAVSLLGTQVLGVTVIALWTFGATAAVFGAIKAMGQARVTPEHEREGLDSSEHGVDTYPEFERPEPVTDGGVPPNYVGVERGDDE